MRTLERKQETRRKIEMGGLVKKAGLHEESAAVLFGLLLEAREKLEEADAIKIRHYWKIKGDIAFTMDE